MVDDPTPKPPRRRLTFSDGKVVRAESRPSKQGWLARAGQAVASNLGTLLTFSGVLVTGAVALFGSVWQKGDPPDARITMVVGKERTVFTAKPGDGIVGIVPVRRTIVLSGASSSDPNDPVDRLSFRWTVKPMFARPDGIAPAPPTSEENDGRWFKWTAVEEGPYEVSLDVTDDRKCNRLQRAIAESGCRKSSTAVVQVLAKPATPPVVQVVERPLGGALNYNGTFKLLARSFDGGPLHFRWLVNGEQVDESDSDPSLVLKIGPGNEFTSAGGYHIEFTAEDRWGGRTSRSFELKVADPSSAEASASPLPKLAGPVTAAMPLNADVVVLDHDVSMGQPGQPLALPRRIVTRGHVLTIAADSLTALSSEILSFDGGEPPQAMNGHAGKPGQNGVAEGEAGKVGEAGGNGVGATGGNDAGPVTITAKSLHGHLTIRNDGSPGARGGDGGDGGDGGNGARGSPSRSEFLGCRSGPGQGGTGGAGGHGGDSGSGGPGGRGGHVSIRLAEALTDGSFDVESTGAAGGNAGRPGRGGAGGSGGPEGETGGFCGGAGRQGAHGAGGAPGLVAAPGQSGAGGQIQAEIGGKTLTNTGRLTSP